MQDSLVDPKTVDVSSRVESLGLRHNFGKRASQRTIATDEDEEAAAQEKASQLLQAAVLEEEEQRRQHGKCWPASNSKPQAIYMVASGEGGSTVVRRHRKAVGPLKSSYAGKRSSWASSSSSLLPPVL